MARRRNKGDERNVAATRVRRLLASARRESLGPDKDLADRHAALAQAVAMRYQMPLGRAGRAQMCRGCGAYRTGTTTRVRLRGGHVATTCLACDRVHRRPLEAA